MSESDLEKYDTLEKVDDFDEFFGGNLVCKGNVVKPSLFLKNYEYVMVYAAASWCPPCKRFSSIITEFLKSKPCKDFNMAVVVIMMDEEKYDYEKYLKKVPELYTLSWEDSEDNADRISDQIGADSLPSGAFINVKTGKLTLCAVNSVKDFINDGKPIKL